jgi:hypothetical protein
LCDGGCSWSLCGNQTEASSQSGPGGCQAASVAKAEAGDVGCLGTGTCASAEPAGVEIFECKVYVDGGRISSSIDLIVALDGSNGCFLAGG